MAIALPTRAQHLATSGKSIARALLNLAIPHECFQCGTVGAWLCERCTASFPLLHPIPCPVCQHPTAQGRAHVACRRELGLEGCLMAANLTHKTIEQLLYGLKYHGLRSVALPCAHLLARMLAEYPLLPEHPNSAAFCPIPLHPQRERERGYNQARLITKALSRECMLPTRELLIRTRATKDQVKLNRAQRLLNLDGAFGPWREASVQEKVVFLIDDVVTSGATLHAAASALRKQWPHLQVWGLAVAYHAHPGTS